MNLSKRLEQLELAQGADNQKGPVILVSDSYDEGAEAAIERWKIENGSVSKNALFIVLVAMK